LREKVARIGRCEPDEGALLAKANPSPGSISLLLDFAALFRKGRE